MPPPKTPSEIARAALKLLATRKLPPTPVHYQECYNEIAQLPNVAGFPDGPLRRIALALTARTLEQEEQLNILDTAISRHSWQGVEAALAAFIKAGVSVPASEAARPATPPQPAVDRALLHQLVHLIQALLPALTHDDSGIADQVKGLIQTLADPGTDLRDLHAELEIFSRRLSSTAEEQGEITKALVRLLHLIIENISVLILEDHWLKGQIGALLDTLSRPLSLRHLDEVEQRLQEVIRKQALARERTMEAQVEMRLMLSAFIGQLSKINQSSTTFQGKLEDSARKIEQVQKLEDLAPLMKEMIGATRAMVDDTAKAREQLDTLQQKVVATEVEITKLHLELDNASAMARHDPLTNALNRKGLDEAMQREIASMQRKGTALALSLLDIDNFKKLNDRLGHEVGDVALIHLVKVVQAYMRPIDTLARYGGEEFVILLPDTPLDEALATMARLQRELTKNFFLANNEKVLITFSAGVAQFLPDESQEDVLKRADQAMYLAKRSGKNRVMAG
jgi:diguanylate cyclase